MPELLGKATYIGQYLYYPPTVTYASCEPSLRLHKLWVATWGPPVAPGPQTPAPAVLIRPGSQKCFIACQRQSPPLAQTDTPVQSAAKSKPKNP